MTERPDLTSLQLIKLTPGTNCWECGFLACLALATQVMAGRGNLAGCPYLGPQALAPYQAQLTKYTRKVSFEKTFDYLRSEVGQWDFRRIAGSLGAVFEEASGQLSLDYFGKNVHVSPQATRLLSEASSHSRG